MPYQTVQKVVNEFRRSNHDLDVFHKPRRLRFKMLSLSLQAKLLEQRQLSDWAHLSILERTVEIERRFGVKISKNTLT